MDTIVDTTAMCTRGSVDRTSRGVANRLFVSRCRVEASMPARWRVMSYDALLWKLDQRLFWFLARIAACGHSNAAHHAAVGADLS